MTEGFHYEISVRLILGAALEKILMIHFACDSRICFSVLNFCIYMQMVLPNPGLKKLRIVSLVVPNSMNVGPCHRSIACPHVEGLL
jgi:hypothetical protein